MTESKVREVIPDLTDKVTSMIEMVLSMRRSVGRLNESLYGVIPKPIDPRVPDPIKESAGSIEVLERKTEELRKAINETDEELKKNLSSLLGVFSEF